MKKNLTIGIPRALLYYRYKNQYITFFKTLKCNVLISDKTTKETIEQGKKYSIDESCLSSKIYLGHIKNLQNKCDYIFIPRISDFGKGEKVCVKFNGTYDTVKNIFPNTKILDTNIEVTKGHTELLSYIKIGKKLNKNILITLYAYYKAKKEAKKYELEEIRKQSLKLNTKKLKILIISHPYNIYDNYIGTPIIKILESMNIEIIYADKMDKKISKKYAQKLSPTLYWTYSKELIGAISYYKSKTDGIIFLTTFPCSSDSLVNELMIRKITDIPITNILIDESNATAGIQTRLESFIDIIKERRNILD